MAQAFEPIRFSVEKILPYALLVLVGSPKIWQVMAVVGLVPSHRDWQKIFGSLRKNEAEKLDIFRLHMATVSFRLKDGLLEKIQNFVAAHLETNLIIINTLEHTRNGEQNSNLYVCDHHDMNRLRQIRSKCPMTMLFVHHMRKMHDPDPMNTISGSMGLVGAKDGAFVLEGKRAPAIARPTSPNRDADGFCFELYFDTKGSKIGKRDGVTVAMPTPLLLLYRRAEEESASANFFAGGDYNSRRTDAADVFS